MAKALVLCGDIGHPDSVLLGEFLTWCSERWTTVFWIPGHHEMTNTWHLMNQTYDQVLLRMRNLVSKWPTVHVLHRESFITEDGFLLLGCPIWSRLTSFSEEFSKDPIMISITKQFEEDLLWLKQQLRSTKLPVIVVSHYPPSNTLMDRNVLNDPLSVPFALETELLLKPPIVAWICGYLHQTVQIHKPWFDAEGHSGSVLIVTNPRGYPKEYTGYRKDAVLRLVQTT